MNKVIRDLTGLAAVTFLGLAVLRRWPIVAGGDSMTDNRRCYHNGGDDDDNYDPPVAQPGGPPETPERKPEPGPENRLKLYTGNLDPSTN